MTNASREDERREARHTEANTDALREMALDTLKQGISMHGDCIDNRARGEGWWL